MSKGVERCVVTFGSTTGAMAMEDACKRAGVPGRLIPIPRSITAGCGMCWAAPLEAQAQVEELLERENLKADSVQTVLFPR